MMVLTILLSSCTGRQNDSLIGRWKMTDMSGRGLGSEGREVREEIVSGEVSVEYNFFRDGRVSVTVTDRFGTNVHWNDWSRADGIIWVADVNYYYHLEASQLTLTRSMWGQHDVNWHFQRLN